jgi:ribonuclease BN (tRNA processing enzyme)
MQFSLLSDLAIQHLHFHHFADFPGATENLSSYSDGKRTLGVDKKY